MRGRCCRPGPLVCFTRFASRVVRAARGAPAGTPPTCWTGTRRGRWTSCRVCRPSRGVHTSGRRCTRHSGGSSHPRSRFRSLCSGGARTTPVTDIVGAIVAVFGAGNPGGLVVAQSFVAKAHFASWQGSAGCTQALIDFEQLHCLLLSGQTHLPVLHWPFRVQGSPPLRLAAR